MEYCDAPLAAWLCAKEIVTTNSLLVISLNLGVIWLSLPVLTPKNAISTVGVTTKTMMPTRTLKLR
jgi:hypothetical protein